MFFSHSLPVPEFGEWFFSIPFPFPNFGNGIIHSRSVLERQEVIPAHPDYLLPIIANGDSMSRETTYIGNQGSGWVNDWERIGRIYFQPVGLKIVYRLVNKATSPTIGKLTVAEWVHTCNYPNSARSNQKIKPSVWMNIEQLVYQNKLVRRALCVAERYFLGQIPFFLLAYPR